MPEWAKAVKSAALEAAGSSSRGSGWALSGPASSWECRAARSRQARSEEAQEPSWGAAKGALGAGCGAAAPIWPLALHAAEVVVEYLGLPLLVERVLRGEDRVVGAAAGGARPARLDQLAPR